MHEIHCMIRQLAKTNIFLGGQVCWDFILGFRDGAIAITDMHIAPVSHFIDYKYGEKTENTLKYPHNENIKALYNKISGNFFNSAINPLLCTNYPIYDANADEYGEYNYRYTDHEYEMGMMRESMSRYGKQASFFVPMWIDDKADIDNGLVFQLTMSKVGSQDTHVNMKDAHLTPDNSMDFIVAIDKNHNASIYEYLKNWAECCSLDDTLMSVDLSNGSAYIKGCLADSGTCTTKDVSSLVADLKSQERPLIESDNLIVQRFAQNKIIAPQLFNFRFFFNIEDICNDVSIINSLPLYNYAWKMSVYPINGALADYKSASPVPLFDFMSNYDNMARTTITDYEDPLTYKYRIYRDADSNIYNYDNENYCIDLVDKNRMVQNTIHWTLQDNPGYTFNIFDGFSSIIRHFNGAESEYWGTNNSQYLTTPNVSADVFSWEHLTYGWMEYYIYSQNNPTVINNIKGYHTKPDYVEKLAALVFDKDDSKNKYVWYNSIKYDKGKFFDLMGEHADELRYNIVFMGANLAHDNWNTQYSENSFGGKYRINIAAIEGDTTTYVLWYESENADVTYNEIVDIVSGQLNSGQIGPQDPLYDAYLVIKCALDSTVLPTQINFNKCIGYKEALAPIDECTDVELHKVGYQKILYRYDGLIYPMFVNVEDTSGIQHNNKYYIKAYKDINDLTLQTKDGNPIATAYRFEDLLNMGYEPLYKSIGFYNKTWQDIYNHSALSHEYQYDYRPNANNYCEQKWYNCNTFIFVPEEIYINKEKKGADGFSDTELKQLLADALCAKFPGADGQQEYIKNYIYPLYSIVYDYSARADIVDGKIADDGLIYTYTVKFQLQ